MEGDAQSGATLKGCEGVKPGITTASGVKGMAKEPHSPL